MTFDWSWRNKHLHAWHKLTQIIPPLNLKNSSKVRWKLSMTQIKHIVTLNKIVQSFNDRHVLDKISTKLNQIYDIGLVILELLWKLTYKRVDCNTSFLANRCLMYKETSNLKWTTSVSTCVTVMRLFKVEVLFQRMLLLFCLPLWDWDCSFSKTQRSTLCCLNSHQCTYWTHDFTFRFLWASAAFICSIHKFGFSW